MQIIVAVLFLECEVYVMPVNKYRDMVGKSAFVASSVAWCKSKTVKKEKEKENNDEFNTSK